MKKTNNPSDKAYFSVGKAIKASLSGKSWIPHTVELLRSPAWQDRSLYLRRLIDRLEIEHMNHNGQENGFLKLTHRQMVKEARIHSDKIQETLVEGEELGLVTMTHRGSYRGGARNNQSTYRLTYLPAKVIPVTGAPLYYNPTNEWKTYTSKPNRRKSVCMPQTGDAISHQTGGPFGPPPKPWKKPWKLPDQAKKAGQANAPDEWGRSSIFGSTTNPNGKYITL